MNERQLITNAFDDARGQGEAVALASVVAVRGSTYRRPGARMLITETGRRTGQVSGGCLERDVTRQASKVLTRGMPALRLYDSLDEDLAEGFALGCNGAVLVLIEPANENVLHLMRVQRACLAHRRRGAIATVYACQDGANAQLGARVSMIEGETPQSSGIASDRLAAALGSAVAQALERGYGGDWSEQTGHGNISAFIEVFTPPLQVLIFGAGQDVVPLVSFGNALGWRMQVVAATGGFGVREQFVAADAVHIGSARDAVATLHPNGDSVVLLMSHNFLRDVEAFCALAPVRPRFFGMLGPQHRAQRLIEEAAARGTRIDDAMRDSIFGPVGLDIGAETPAEVALAISAEIQALMQGRHGGHARLRNGPLHTDVLTRGADARALEGQPSLRLCKLEPV
ncbi:XdhC family protein [Thauera sp. JM12B12]|uniref:XdhC family protein n=1 Tax=Thauera sp. JM12B12 TaxID=3142262 RepID=UPI0031F44D09